MLIAISSFYIELLGVLLKIHNELTIYLDHINTIETLLRKVYTTDQVPIIEDFNRSHTSWKAVPDSNYLIPIGSSESAANIIDCLLESCLFKLIPL